ncbi:DUF6097 family protein [Isoptericola sp. NPDC057391]|uniref:DUF6097 family protein n=1 Tax=Isoptericola sp. NPDC057391 TaxID=3346117 RepID=UPI00363401F9
MTHVGPVLSATVEQAEELRRLHTIITERDLPIPLRDDFAEQCTAVEQHLGGDEFTNLSRRIRRINALSGWIAAPVLIAAVVLYVVGKFTDLLPVDDVLTLFLNPVVIAVLAVILVSVLGIALWMRSANRRLLGPVYGRLLQRLTTA